nr:E3 ubiquitin ligase TRAF3IP2 isoform X2 [Scatophagus argus]
MDESMTPSSLDLAFLHSCKQCSGHTESSNRPQDHDQTRGAAHNVDQWRLSKSQYPHAPEAVRHPAPQPPFGLPTHSGRMEHPHPAPWHQRRGCSPDHSVEAEGLEPPLPLMSDVSRTYYVPPQYRAARAPGPDPVQGSFLRQCACCPPAKMPHPIRNSPHQEFRHHQQLRNPNAPNGPHGPPPQCANSLGEVIHEVSVNYPILPDPLPATKEFRRTISLPEECRNVFITYSVDTAQQIIPFVKFLNDNGLRPAIDIFENPVQIMGITKWMDRFLNDKSVLIIVVISPKYKEDLEGDAGDEHGLHTKYIHNQIQNEYIQQGCLNFRLVPVLFPNATKRHVPSWLQSTRIYRWPDDSQDLLLRLFRRERYIMQQRGGNLTLTLRPL